MPNTKHQHSPLRLLRLPGVRAKYPRCKSSIYSDIADGLFVPPVGCGDRCSTWPEHEVDAIIAARIAGASDDAIRNLVTKLIIERRGTP